MAEIMTFADDTDQPQEISQHIVISRDKSVYVPEIIRKSIVYRDHNVECLTFDCPRYWSGIDISELNIYVNYIAEGQKKKKEDPGSFLCENVVVDEDNTEIFHFDWRITSNASEFPDKLIFLVCAKSVDAEGNEDVHWNSHLCKDLEVQEGLEASDSIVNKYPDVIESILSKLGKQIEFRNSGTAIQYRNAGENIWTDLVQLEDIKGDAAVIIESNFKGSDTTANIIAKAGETGDKWYSTDEGVYYMLSASGEWINCGSGENLKKIEDEIDALKGDISQLSEEIASIDLGYDEYGVLHIFINGNPVGDGVQVSAGDFIAVTGLSVSPAEVKFKLSDGKVTLSTIITPENATNKKIIWESSDTSVATVNNGVITAVANGSTIITVSCGGYIASINVNVSIPVPVAGISFDVTEMSGEEGDILNAQAYTITPIDATNRNVIWSSSTPSVATVDAGGKVTCLAEGIAIITVTTEDGGKTASYTLSVGHPETYIKENLLVDYDGINNVGTGVQDTTATVWKDLSGNGYDIDLASIISYGNTNKWIESDGFSVGYNATGTPVTKEPFSVGEVDCSTSGFTVSFVGIPSYSHGNGSVISAYDVDVTSISYYQWSYGVQIPFSPNDPAHVRVNCAGNVALPDECKINNKKVMLTVVEKPGNEYEIYYNGVLVKSGTGSGTHSMVLKYVGLFDRIQAQICHVSVYSKALTEDEIAQNFRVFDKIYFVSGISSVSGNYPASGTVLPYTSVPIASAKIIPTDKASATTVTYTTSNESVVVIDE